MKQADLTD